MAQPVRNKKTQKRAALETLAWRILFKKWQENPLLWLKERFGEDPKSFRWSDWGEGYETHAWDGTPDPLATAWKALANNEWAGVESATGVGKTFYLARVVFWFLDVFEDSLVVTSAAVASQLKEQLWSEMKTAFHKFKKIRPHAYLFNSLRLLVDARGFDELAPDEENQNAWGAFGVASRASSGSQSNTGRQGFHRKHMLIIVEEAPGTDHASLAAYENTSVGDHNLILCVGNPDNEFDPLHVFCQKARVRHIRASALDAPNVVLGRTVVEGAVTSHSIATRATEYGTVSNLYMSRVRGISPGQSVNSLIKAEWIDASIEDGKAHPYPQGVGAAGVDVANSEAGDKAAVAMGIGNVLLFLKEFQCPDASHLAYNLLYDSIELESRGYRDYQIPTIYDYNIRPECVGIDAIGVGVSTVHAFHEHYQGSAVVSLQSGGGALAAAIPTDNEGKPLFGFDNLRAQMYWELREDMRMGRVFIKIDDKTLLHQLKQELATPKYSSKTGKIKIDSKDDIKKRLGHSPNLADAVVYWNWVRKRYYVAEDENDSITFDIAV
jgi:hypothetical protein